MTSPQSIFLRPSLLIAAVVVSLALSGCSMGSIELSGSDPASSTVSVNMGGKVHGGQQPVSYSTLNNPTTDITTATSSSPATSPAPPIPPPSPT